MGKWPTEGRDCAPCLQYKRFINSHFGDLGDQQADERLRLGRLTTNEFFRGLQRHP